jgi:hypothetical protein
LGALHQLAEIKLANWPPTYLMSMWKFCERSAAKLAVGEDPRTGLIAKLSDVGGFILISLKLNAPGPNLLAPDRCEFACEL